MAQLLKIFTNHGVKATTIMQWSIPASSPWASLVIAEASLRNYIVHPSSEQLRACLISFVMCCMEGHISHSSQDLQTLSPGAIFMFLWIQPPFIHKTHSLRILFSTSSVKELLYFYAPQFQWISLNGFCICSVLF